jgi:hypothetical protein
MQPLMKTLLMLFVVLLPLSPVPTQTNADKKAGTRIALFEERTRQINDLAGNIQSPDDAHRIVDLIAEVFADDLPPAWSTRSIRDRIAHAEYASAGRHAKLIPEQQLVDAWNRYITTIGASHDAIVTVAEIHNLRDGSYTMAQFMWSRGPGNIFAMPNIYATGQDGKVADGCTAVEALRVLYDLSNQFGNLREARERVKQGVMISDTFRPLAHGTAGVSMRVSGGLAVRDNPVEDAEIRYTQEHGAIAMDLAIETLLYDLFPTAT